MQNTSLRYKAFEAAEILKIPNKNLDANAETRLLKQNEGYAVDTENQIARLRAVVIYYWFVVLAENENTSMKHLIKTKSENVESESGFISLTKWQ